MRMSLERNSFGRSKFRTGSIERAKLKIEVLRLRGLGFSFVDIMEQLGLKNTTLGRIINRDKRFKKALDEVSTGTGKYAVEHSLFELAKGAKENTITSQYKEERIIDGEVTEVLVTNKVVTKVPNEKAVLSLAHKYCRGEYSPDKEQVEHTIRITGRERSLSIEERKELLAKDSSAIVDVDYKELIDKVNKEAEEVGLLGS